MAEYVAGKGTTALGIIGTVLGSLGVAGNNGIGLFNTGGNCSSDNMLVNRYEQSMQSRISELETEVKLRDANAYTISQIDAFRNYVDGKFAHVEKEICDQKVYNTANTATINCLAGQVAQLMSLTKVVIPNANVCPGWGDVTVSITPTPTTTA